MEEHEINLENPIRKNTTKTTKTKKTKKKKKKTGRKVLLVILVILIALIGFFLFRSNQNGGGMQGMLATLVGHNPETLKDLDPIYFLVLGESVSGDSRLTDTIIACKYDPKTQTAAMLSIPRDTYTGKDKSQASAYYKINNAYKMGQAPENTVKEVNKITGLNIEYYVWVNTNILKEIVDEVGGVYFDVPTDMHYTDVTQDLYINLEKGYQLLDGNKAEQVVRFRHNDDGSSYSWEYGLEDYGRMRTQRAFISATVKQVLKPENILKVGDFLDIAYRNIKTNMPIEVMKDYIPYAVNFSTDNLQTEQLPGKDDDQNPTRTSMFIHDPEKTKEVVDKLFINPVVEEPEEENNTTEENKVTNTTNTVD